MKKNNIKLIHLINNIGDFIDATLIRDFQWFLKIISINICGIKGNKVLIISLISVNVFSTITPYNGY